MYFFPAIGKSVKKLSSLLFPSLCLGCRQLEEDPVGVFCPSCLAALNLFSHEGRCSFCLTHLDGKGCKSCFHVSDYKRLITTFEPSFSGKKLIAIAKRRDEFYKTIGAFVVCQILENGFPAPDWIVPIPDQRVHFLEEGYRYSFHLSKEIAFYFSCKSEDLFSNQSISLSKGDEFIWKKRVDISSQTILVVDIWHDTARFSAIGKLLQEGFPDEIYGVSLMCPEENLHLFEGKQELVLQS